MIEILQTTNQNFIWTDEPIYCDSTPRNLVRKICLECNLDRSESNVERCVSVWIKNPTTFNTLEDRIFSISFVNSVTDRTFLRSMSWIDFDYLYRFSDADVIQSREEPAIRDSANKPVELPTSVMASQIPYVFNSNHSIKFFSNIDYLPSNLFTPCLDKIALPALQSAKIFFIVDALKLCSSQNIPSLSDCDISPKIKLPQDFLSDRIVDRYGCKVHRTYVNTYYDIFINRFWKVFFENNFDLIFNNNNSFEVPTILEKTIESLISSVFFDGNYNLVFKGSKPDTESSSVREKCFESSIFELGRQSDKIVLDFLPFNPYFPPASLDKLGEEPGFTSQLVISQLMQLFLSKGVILFEN